MRFRRDRGLAGTFPLSMPLAVPDMVCVAQRQSIFLVRRGLRVQIPSHTLTESESLMGVISTHQGIYTQAEHAGMQVATFILACPPPL